MLSVFYAWNYKKSAFWIYYNSIKQKNRQTAIFGLTIFLANFGYSKFILK